MITEMIVLAIILCAVAFAFGAFVVPRLGKGGQQKFTSNATLEHIKEMGDLTVMTAYVKEVVTVSDDRGWHTRESKMIVICNFDIEFRYDLKRIKFSRTSDGVISMTLPPHFIKTIPKGTHFYHEQEAKFLGLFQQDFSTEDRNRLLQEAQARAIEQADVLRAELQDKVRASAKTTLASVARGFGVSMITFDFEDCSSIVHHISQSKNTAAA